jgi:hypothetical protein
MEEQKRKAAVYHGFGSPGVLELTDVAKSIAKEV